ncbi:MAG: DUF4129 domain-containing protein [Acidobacteriota bacterium]
MIFVTTLFCHFRPRSLAPLAIRCAVVFLLLQMASVCWAIPLNDYHKQLRQALGALTTLAQQDEGETEESRAARIRKTIAAVRVALPQTESNEVNETSVTVDNSWLHRELDNYEKAAPAERSVLLARINERLLALEQRVEEVEKANSTTGDKAAARKKLNEILQRPEYATSAKQPSALARLWDEFWKWLQELLPKPKPLEPGRGNLLTLLAEIFVVALALGGITYVIVLISPRVFRGRTSRKKTKAGPRIVLGERLEPDQSAPDLLAEAEALARRGELRAAIRKAYIALLVELGERKIISLEQHMTNRDYLRALRTLEPLHSDVKQLTDSFERHWYGFALATEADWTTFRDRYKQALRR